MKLHPFVQTLALCGAIGTAAAQVTPAPLSGVAASGETFFKVDFPNVHGNGRSCATCHVPEEAFQLNPQSVEARYQALQAARLNNPLADDPLFRSIDADDFADDFTTLRQHALVRVIIQLPVDPGGHKLVGPLNDPTATTVAVWRSTPSVLNTAFTEPYQQDGRIPTLQQQALGALTDHAEITSQPELRFLNDVAAFEKSMFSSPAVKRLAEALALGQTPPPTDPLLTPLEQEGKALFIRHCVNCHGGADANGAASDARTGDSQHPGLQACAATGRTSAIRRVAAATARLGLSSNAAVRSGGEIVHGSGHGADHR